MTNNNMYFVANWKMFGNLSSVHTLNKVIKLTKNKRFTKFRIIYCPPYTLINEFVKKTKKNKILVGAQDCHHVNSVGPFTGSVSANQIKNLGAKYIILGHSEKRSSGDTNQIVNKKIISALSENLKVILCIGETLDQKKKGLTKNVILKQLSDCLKNIKNLKNIVIAYEPIWSIGTGKILDYLELDNIITKIKNTLKKKYKMKNSKVLYGGSVNSKNILYIKKVKGINGFLVGSASQNQNKFVDILKKSII